MKFPSLFRSENQRRSRLRRGVVTIEVALCLIFVLLPVTLGGFQFALVFITQHALQQVARESARFAAVHYNEDTFDANENQGTAPGSAPSLKYIIRKQAAANGFGWSDINGVVSPVDQLKGSITVTPADSERISGQPLTITITYPMKRRALLGSLMFKKEVVVNGKTTGQISLMRLGFLENDFSASSTILME